MPKIALLSPIESIKPGDPPDVTRDGTILNPIPYLAVDVTFDDGIMVQVERPLTLAKIRVAYRNTVARKNVTVDEVSTGDTVTP